jgi:hypothetical protein
MDEQHAARGSAERSLGASLLGFLTFALLVRSHVATVGDPYGEAAAVGAVFTFAAAIWLAHPWLGNPSDDSGRT